MGMSAARVRPSRVWYGVGAAFAAGAVVWLVLSLVLGLTSLGSEIDGFQRVPIPGTGEVTFAEPGSYVLYYEEGPSGENVGWFDVSLTPASGGGPVQLNEFKGSLTFDLSGHSGRAIKTVHVDKPGKFLLQTELIDPGGRAYVAVGRNFAGDIVRTVVLTVAGTAVLFFGGTAIVVVVAIRRGRARRRLLTTGVEEPGGHASPGQGSSSSG